MGNVTRSKIEAESTVNLDSKHVMIARRQSSRVYMRIIYGIIQLHTSSRFMYHESRR